MYALRYPNSMAAKQHANISHFHERPMQRLGFREPIWLQSCKIEVEAREFRQPTWLAQKIYSDRLGMRHY